MLSNDAAGQLEVVSTPFMQLVRRVLRISARRVQVFVTYNLTP
jgi:hypothetical protein